jgi:hypothetical protein
LNKYNLEPIPTLEAWREEHPGQPDPDDATLQNWLAAVERNSRIYEWSEAHPGRPVPDYAEVQRWCIEQHTPGTGDILSRRS